MIADLSPISSKVGRLFCAWPTKSPCADKDIGLYPFFKLCYESYL